MNKYTIGTLSRITGVSVKTLRGYEDKGLITPSRDELNNYRFYDENSIDTVNKIAAMQYLGLSLDKIKLVFDGEDLSSILQEQKQDYISKIRQLERTIECIDRVLCGNSENRIEDIERAVIISKVDMGFSEIKRFHNTPLEWNRWIYNQADITDGMHILDGGCGYGNLWRSVQDNTANDLKITCVDFHNTNADLFYNDLKNGVIKNNSEFTFLWGDIEEIKFRQQFDRIFLNHLLMYIKQPEKLLHKLKNKLKSKGTVICTLTGERINAELADVFSKNKINPSKFGELYKTQTKTLEYSEKILKSVFEKVEKYEFTIKCNFDKSIEFYNFLYSCYPNLRNWLEFYKPQILSIEERIALTKNTLLYKCKGE